MSSSVARPRLNKYRASDSPLWRTASRAARISASLTLPDRTRSRASGGASAGSEGWVWVPAGSVPKEPNPGGGDGAGGGPPADSVTWSPWVLPQVWRGWGCPTEGTAGPGVGAGLAVRSLARRRGLGQLWVVEAVDRPFDLVGPGHHREELPAQRGPQVVHGHDVARIGHRDHRGAEPPPHRDGTVPSGHRLAQDGLGTGGERRVREVDEPEVVVLGQPTGARGRRVGHSSPVLMCSWSLRRPAWVSGNQPRPHASAMASPRRGALPDPGPGQGRAGSA